MVFDELAPNPQTSKHCVLMIYYFM